MDSAAKYACSPEECTMFFLTQNRIRRIKVRNVAASLSENEIEFLRRLSEVHGIEWQDIGDCRNAKFKLSIAASLFGKELIKENQAQLFKGNGWIGTWYSLTDLGYAVCEILRHRQWKSIDLRRTR